MINYFSNLIRNFSLIFKKFDAIVYFEYSSDINHLHLIVEELKKFKKLKLVFLHSEPLTISKNQKNTDSYYISNGIFRTFLFNLIHSKIFILTMTDIDNSYLKKSIFCDNYIYIFHSLLSTHMGYLEKAFDNYNTVLCCGNYQIQEIKKREKIYNLQKKNLIPFCHSRIHAMKKLKKKKKINQKIIVTSTWGENSISEKVQRNFFENLLDAGFEVFYQMHKMSEKRKKKFLFDPQDVKKKYKTFNYSFEYQSINSLSDYSLMISDWSGAAHEFCFGFRKPVVFLDLEKKIRNPNYNSLDIEPFEVKIRKKIGKIIKLKDCDNMIIIIKKLLKLSKDKSWDNKIMKIEKEFLFNYQFTQKKVFKFLIDQLGINA